jgi:acyl-CoA thioester hydrolase
VIKLNVDHKYKKMVHFHETDVMGVVHHSNYLKFFEEARVDWLRFKGLKDTHFPFCDRMLAVTETQVIHDSASRFGDELEITLQVRAQRLKIEFQYVITNPKEMKLVARGRTFHVLVDKDLKPRRPEKRFLSALAEELEKQPWIETLL